MATNAIIRRPPISGFLSLRRHTSTSSSACTTTPSSPRPNTRPARRKRTKPVDETTLAGAQHKVSLSGPSLGHLISELSATQPGMEHVRGPHRDMPEEQRTMIRNVVKAIVVVPTLIGLGIVGWNWWGEREAGAEGKGKEEGG